MKKILIVLLAALYVQGCALAPDKAGLWAIHHSTPFRGDLPPPIGDHGHTAEAVLDGLQGTLRWDSPACTVEAGMTYALRNKNMVLPDKAQFTLRIGKEFDL